MKRIVLHIVQCCKITISSCVVAVFLLCWPKHCTVKWENTDFTWAVSHLMLLLICLFVIKIIWFDFQWIRNQNKCHYLFYCYSSWLAEMDELNLMLPWFCYCWVKKTLLTWTSSVLKALVHGVQCLKPWEQWSEQLRQHFSFLSLL